LARWLKIESILAQAVPFYRRDNYYCRFQHERSYSRRRKYEPLDVWRWLKPQREWHRGNDRDKRVSLNVTNFAHAYYFESHKTNHALTRKTIEFRFPEGTLDGRDVEGWVRLFLMFVNSSAGAKMPSDLTAVSDLDEFWSYFGLHDPRKFYILSKPILDMKSWFYNRLFVWSWRERLRQKAVEKQLSMSDLRPESYK